MNNPYLENYIFKSQLKSDLLYKRIDININTKLVINYFIKYLKKIKFKYEYEHSDEYDYPEELIDINSPFFDELSESGIFEEFSILIALFPINEFIQLKLKNDYTSIFDKLNKSKSKYSSITFYINDNANIDHIKQFNIDFKQIERLTIISGIIKNISNYNAFLWFKKNLKYLYLKNCSREECFNSDNFFNFENFASLEHLVLNGFIFDKILTIKVKNLKVLKLKACNNVEFYSENLQELYLIFSNYLYISNCKNLKILKYFDENIQNEIKMLENIFSKNSLEYIDILFYIFADKNILNIKGNNTSVKNF